MGEMSMSIGATTSWNHHHLFPDGDYEQLDEIEDSVLIDSVTRWGQRNICPRSVPLQMKNISYYLCSTSFASDVCPLYHAEDDVACSWR